MSEISDSHAAEYQLIELPRNKNVPQSKLACPVLTETSFIVLDNNNRQNSFVLYLGNYSLQLLVNISKLDLRLLL